MSLNKKYKVIFIITTLIILFPDISLLNSANNTNYPALDETRSFWAYSYITQEYSQVNARLLGSSNFCALYMDEDCITKLGKASVMAKVEDICNEFDEIIYPRIVDLAGHPNGTMGDIDGDPRIFILFHDSYNYYSEVNDIEYNWSNHCEMIYIHYGLYQHSWLYPTVAHEFHHLIWFNHEWGEPPFILEALAQYATYHAGYLDSYNNLVPQVASFLPYPENSPLYWSDDRDYGSSYLFAFYLAEKYGVQILRDLITESSKGLQGIEAVLQKAGYNITFNELFINWITALTIDKLDFQGNLYGFEGLDAQISSYEVVSNLPFLNKTISLGHYAFKILKINSPPNNFTISIFKSPQESLGVVFAIHSASGWQVQQYLHYEEKNEIIDSFSGFSIEEAYIILSYISKNTPIAPKERGPGPSIEIDLTLNESINITSSSVTTLSTRTTKTLGSGINFSLLIITFLLLAQVIALISSKSKR